MRARSREVNIFNMSLLDILCGALGAFCFMMLALLPYYKPANGDLRQQEVNTDDLLRQLEQLKDRAKDSALAQQMNDLVNKLQDQVKQMQGELNRYANENQRLQEENKNLTQTNEKQGQTLAMRHPFLTLVGTIPIQDVDLYLLSDNTTEDNTRTNPPFNLTKSHNETFWNGDIAQWWPQHGVSMWITRDAPAGVHYKIYAKLAGEPATRQACQVNGSLTGPTWNVDLPAVPLTPARFWTLIGTATMDDQGKAAFVVATDKERDAEWVKLSKGTPPPAAEPSATAQQMPFSKEEKDKRVQEYIRQRMGGGTPAASASPAKSP